MNTEFTDDKVSLADNRPARIDDRRTKPTESDTGDSQADKQEQASESARSKVLEVPETAIENLGDEQVTEPASSSVPASAESPAPAPPIAPGFAVMRDAWLEKITVRLSKQARKLAGKSVVR